VSGEDYLEGPIVGSVDGGHEKSLGMEDFGQALSAKHKMTLTFSL